MRIAYLALGWIMVGLAVVGAFLPVMPTTPFLLLAVWLFARSSPKLEQWLLTHPTFGSSLTNWQREGAISRRAKISAVSLMALSYGLFWWSRAPSAMVAAIVAAVMLASAAFILSRPGPRS
ncbi:MAG: YbaN family protein [Allorhizobium sp.]